MIYELKQLYHRLRLTWRYFRTFGIPEVEPPHPAALARAKEQGAHYFIVKATWDAEAQTWLVSCPEISDDEAITNHDDLPGALAMFGDAAMLHLEHDMQHDLYPTSKRDEVIVHDHAGRVGTLGANVSVVWRR